MIKNGENKNEGIYAFQEGNCIELKNLKENLQVTESTMVSTDFEQLSTILKYITITINKNAEYMRNISKSQNQLEKTMYNFLQGSTNNMNLYFKIQKQSTNQILEEDNNLEVLGNGHLELEKKFLKSFNDERRTTAIMEKKISHLESIVNNMKSKLINKDPNNEDGDNIPNNLCSDKELSEFKKEFTYKLNRVQNSMLDYTSKDFVDVLFSDLKKCQEDDSDELRELIENINREILDLKKNEMYQMKKNEDYGSEKQKERIEKLEENLRLQKDSIDSNQNDFLNVKKKFNCFSKRLKKLIREDKNEENQKRISFLEDKFFRKGENIFDILDELNPRLFLIENLLENKLDREKFFEFVSENFVRKKNYEAEKSQVDSMIHNLRNTIENSEKEYKQFKYNIVNKIEDLKHTISPLKEVQQSLKEKILTLMSQENGGERMYNRLEKKIESLEEFFITKYTARMNNLATAKGLQCLSCGEKDINYPPQTQFLKGEDDNMYCIPNKYYLYTNNEKRLETANLNKKGVDDQEKNKELSEYNSGNENNKENTILKRVSSGNSNVRNSNFRLNSATTNNKSIRSNKLSDFVNKKFVTGQKVFDKSHLLSEHFFKSHLPMEEIIDNKIYNGKFRPFSSIPKRK